MKPRVFRLLARLHQPDVDAAREALAECTRRIDILTDALNAELTALPGELAIGEANGPIATLGDWLAGRQTRRHALSDLRQELTVERERRRTILRERHLEVRRIETLGSRAAQRIAADREKCDARELDEIATIRHGTRLHAKAAG